MGYFYYLLIVEYIYRQLYLDSYSILYPTDEIKVLGVTLDDILNFKSHVTDICNRASRQINSFKMFAKYLKIDRRLSV